jgi:hypothetical protein
MNDLRDMISKMEKGKSYCYYFIHPVDFSDYPKEEDNIFMDAWNTEEENGKYYFHSIGKHVFNWRYGNGCDTFISFLSMINNDKNLALLNIQNANKKHGWWGQKICKEIINGNKIFIDNFVS